MASTRLSSTGVDWEPRRCEERLGAQKPGVGAELVLSVLGGKKGRDVGKVVVLRGCEGLVRREMGRVVAGRENWRC